MRIWENFADICEDENSQPVSITFKNTEHFNFAFDVVDAMAEKSPQKLALLHVSRDRVARSFTFGDISRDSSKAANYFSFLGIKRGHRVLLVLKRHYQFWPIINALHKIGAVAIPATSQLMEEDFDYRFRAAGISAVICTADGNTAAEAELAMMRNPQVRTKVIVNGTREGWNNYDEDVDWFSPEYKRTEDAPGGDEPSFMFFTSGTTAYPKIASHSYKYPLGHIITAKYWQNVDPDGLHLTISETGWAKSLWGKIYGQWLCEAAVFVYDFDRFSAADIMPMFKKYNITTFCAPPTMYRFFIKEDLSKYDLSSIKHATTAGEALNPEVLEQFKKATGLTIMEGFGQTETTLVAANFRGTTPRPGSMGKASPLFPVEILRRDGTPAGYMEPGEIVINTENGAPCGLFLGYYNDRAMTESSWFDGRYHTGDTACMDKDGYLWYVGRTDDIIKSSGYRIGPFEIENVIMELPYVLECAITGVPDEIRGQVVKASIVLTKDAAPSDELKKEIQDYVKHHTAPYKYPRIVEFMDELPKTISGKIRRVQLREEK